MRLLTSLHISIHHLCNICQYTTWNLQNNVERKRGADWQPARPRFLRRRNQDVRRARCHNFRLCWPPCLWDNLYSHNLVYQMSNCNWKRLFAEKKSFVKLTFDAVLGVRVELDVLRARVKETACFSAFPHHIGHAIYVRTCRNNVLTFFKIENQKFVSGGWTLNMLFF